MELNAGHTLLPPTAPWMPSMTVNDARTRDMARLSSCILLCLKPSIKSWLFQVNVPANFMATVCLNSIELDPPHTHTLLVGKDSRWYSACLARDRAEEMSLRRESLWSILEAHRKMICEGTVVSVLAKEPEHTEGGRGRRRGRDWCHQELIGQSAHPMSCSRPLLIMLHMDFSPTHNTA